MIVWHHPPASIWEMTPRQVFDWVILGLDREKLDRARRLSDAASAARGEGRDIERTLKELTDT